MGWWVGGAKGNGKGSRDSRVLFRALVLSEVRRNRAVAGWGCVWLRGGLWCPAGRPGACCRSPDTFRAGLCPRVPLTVPWGRSSLPLRVRMRLLLTWFPFCSADSVVACFLVWSCAALVPFS